VRLGDLKLVKAVVKQKIVEYREIPHKKTGVVKRRVPEVVGVRRIYLACMHGSQDDFTAVVYEGSDFEKASYITWSVNYPHNSESHSTGLMQNSGKSFGDSIIYREFYTI
jgi:hypothetical protein